ncbi:class I SAM-dependent methyltransferase [Spirillospora albida]|uniref:class I SAM-dependent methyltransferase n=1 Tax=Spirillospora albida TaxID=58123 RepID=UPI0006918A01|nr:class I SAM-dependent methyltransferase [Spirillospora albida]
MDTSEIQRIARIEDANWWYRERRAIVSRELPHLGVPGVALDVGAATGGTARVLQRRGWHVTAVDLNPDAVALARERGVDAHQGDARYLQCPTSRYDLVLALDVLEHIEEDARAAAEIARVLRPGGVALVSVPCDMELWSAHDVAAGRVRRYERQDLITLIEDAGLMVERLWSAGVLLRPLLRRLRHRSPRREDLAPLPPPVNAALARLCAMERRLPVSGRPGTRVFVRARRPWGAAIGADGGP